MIFDVFQDWGDMNHNAEQRKVLPGRMSYITVQENAIKWWVTVNGLNHHEVSNRFQAANAWTFLS